MIRFAVLGRKIVPNSLPFAYYDFNLRNGVDKNRLRLYNIVDAIGST